MGAVKDVAIELVGGGATPTSGDVIVRTPSDVIRFSNVAFVTAKVTNLEVDDVFTVAVCVTLHVPYSLYGFKAFAFLQIPHSTNVTVWAFAVVNADFVLLRCRNESSIRYLSQNIWRLSSPVNEGNIFEDFLYSVVL